MLRPTFRLTVAPVPVARQQRRPQRPIAAILAALLIAVALLPLTAAAQTPSPAQLAEQIRSRLTRAQLALAADRAQAAALVDESDSIYTADLGPQLRPIAPDADRTIAADLAVARAAVARGDAAAYAAARASIWTAMLAGAYAAADTSLAAGDVAAAQRWLSLREYRHSTRFLRPDADATRALHSAASGQMSIPDASAALHAELLDTYQAKLTEALSDVRAADRQGFAMRRAEAGALADGYFAILAPSLAQQRGEPARAAASGAFSELAAVALRGGDLDAATLSAEQSIAGFRAAPLSQADQVRRAGQLMRFLALVPVEYSRGVAGGKVTKDLELREATTFHDGALAAFNDLRSLLEQRDAPATAQMAAQFAAIETLLASANAQSAADPAALDAQVAALDASLRAVMPQEWLRHNNAADFDVIQTALDQMERAVAAGDYELAESARLEAYAILESGPEAKLIVFAPQFKPSLESLFWYGQEERKGLAHLIGQRASQQEIRQSRQALNAELASAQKALVGNNAPMAVGTNAAVIVFREGLEAVLILASLMGSMKFGEQRKLRRPLWAGAALALGASALTWVAAQGALTMLARYGERLEAIVSLIAIGVLLLITNWFFHDVYWKGWMSNFHQQKRRMTGGQLGQTIGLVTLGFASIYREGFETVLFLQALVLESGAATVLAGVAAGLAATVGVGLVVFLLQAKLPHKKMLIATGMMIVFVLMQMVGNTVHVMQVVGWMSIHPIRSLDLPYWAGMWFGLYATWEGIALQIAAGLFTIGSYFVAERMQHAKQDAVIRSQTARAS